MKKSLCAAICSMALLGLAQDVRAADLGSLRGSEVFEPQLETYDRWEGFYFGGQAGYGNAQMNFRNSTSPLVANMLRESTLEVIGQVSTWPMLGTADRRDISWGGFIGYNSQWENAILGVELNYNRTSLFGESTDSLSRRVTVGNLFYDTTVDADASMRLTDYGTARARAGWVMGRFMPYLMGGLALGRVEAFRQATVSGNIVDPATGASSPFGMTQSETRTVYAIGYTAGAGLEVALLPNVFVRGEFEWLQFRNLPDMKMDLVTGRVGAGLKF
jgi:outer membrane immunogenic protein